EQKLEERLVALEAAKAWSPRVVFAAGNAVALGHRGGTLPHQSNSVRDGEVDRRGRSDRPFPPRLRGRAIRHGLAAGLSDVLRRCRELPFLTQTAHPFPLPPLSKRLRLARKTASYAKRNEKRASKK